MKVRITMEVADDIADPNHSMGVTNEGYERIVEALIPYGDDIDIKRETDTQELLQGDSHTGRVGRALLDHDPRGD